MSQGDKQGNFYSLKLLKKQSDMNSYVDKIKKSSLLMEKIGTMQDSVRQQISVTNTPTDIFGKFNMPRM